LFKSKQKPEAEAGEGDEKPKKVARPRSKVTSHPVTILSHRIPVEPHDQKAAEENTEEKTNATAKKAAPKKRAPKKKVHIFPCLDLPQLSAYDIHYRLRKTRSLERTFPRGLLKSQTRQMNQRPKRKNQRRKHLLRTPLLKRCLCPRKH